MPLTGLANFHNVSYALLSRQKHKGVLPGGAAVAPPNPRVRTSTPAGAGVAAAALGPDGRLGGAPAAWDGEARAADGPAPQGIGPDT